VTFVGFPGGDLVERGIADLRCGRESVEALLVSIGAPRLRRMGIDVPTPIESPEHRLYDRLAAEDLDAAHGRFNALVRRLVSFERAVEPSVPGRPVLS
jgi:hypothetical protein